MFQAVKQTPPVKQAHILLSRPPFDTHRARPDKGGQWRLGLFGELALNAGLPFIAFVNGGGQTSD